MPPAKGVVFPWKHHAFCLTHEAAFGDVQRLIQLFIAHHKTCASEQEYTEFALAYSQLLNLPEDLFKLTWLQKLALNYHRISTLPESLDKLYNLQYLYLDHNRLTSLPNSVINLVHLRVLSLSYNKLKFICPLGMITLLKLHSCIVILYYFCLFIHCFLKFNPFHSNFHICYMIYFHFTTLTSIYFYHISLIIILILHKLY